jgi:hypothetical protein
MIADSSVSLDCYYIVRLLGFNFQSYSNSLQAVVAASCSLPTAFTEYSSAIAAENCWMAFNYPVSMHFEFIAPLEAPLEFGSKEESSASSFEKRLSGIYYQA